MNNSRELRKLSRKDLLEILLEQTKRIEELELELDITKKELNSKRILIEESGSLAEATLKLNGIFELAQQTAEEYIENIKENCRILEEKTKKECEEEKNKMLKETNKYIKEIKKKNKISTKKSVNNPKKTTRKTSKNKEEIVVTTKKPIKRKITK